MKKILFFASTLGSGGAERQMINLSILLKQKGYIVEFFCLNKSQNFYKQDLIKNNIDVRYLKDFKIYIPLISTCVLYIRSIYYFVKYTKLSHTDVVITFLPFCNFIACVSKLFSNYRLIIGERSSKEVFFNSFIGKIYSLFYKYSDNIVCNSNNSKELWLKYYPKYCNKLSVIYNIIHMTNISSKYYLKVNNKLHLFIAASYQYIKNPFALINAVLLLDENEREKIVISWYGRKEVFKGDSKVYDESLDLIIKNKLENIICLQGETKDIYNQMIKADFVCLFSTIEGLPNSICEGMMIGKPIIMTKVSDYNQLIDHTNGFICDSFDSHSIKKTLSSAINLSNNEIIQMGLSSKEKANCLFSNDIIIQDWIELIEKNDKCSSL